MVKLLKTNFQHFKYGKIYHFRVLNVETQKIVNELWFKYEGVSVTGNSEELSVMMDILYINPTGGNQHLNLMDTTQVLKMGDVYQNQVTELISNSSEWLLL